MFVRNAVVLVEMVVAIRVLERQMRLAGTNAYHFSFFWFFRTFWYFSFASTAVSARPGQYARPGLPAPDP
jgi:hypothetical protein